MNKNTINDPKDTTTSTNNQIDKDIFEGTWSAEFIE